MTTSWSGLKSHFHLMGIIFAIAWECIPTPEFCSCASGSVARSLELKIFQSKLFSSRNYKSTKSRRSRRYVDIKVYTKARKRCTACAAGTRCERSFGRGKTIDTRFIAELILLSRDMSRRRSQYKFKITMRDTRSDFRTAFL